MLIFYKTSERDLFFFAHFGTQGPLTQKKADFLYLEIGL